MIQDLNRVLITSDPELGKLDKWDRSMRRNLFILAGLIAIPAIGAAALFGAKPMANKVSEWAKPRLKKQIVHLLNLDT